jgi:hypothetical protein
VTPGPFRLSEGEIDALAGMFGDADAKAAETIGARQSDRRAKAAELVAVRANLKAALFEELIDRGCPPGRIQATASAIVVRSVRARKASAERTSP